MANLPVEFSPGLHPKGTDAQSGFTFQPSTTSWGDKNVPFKQLLSHRKTSQCSVYQWALAPVKFPPCLQGKLYAPTAFCIHPPQCIPPPLTGSSFPSLALLLSPSQIHVQTAANLCHSSFTAVASLHRKHPHKVCFLHLIIKPSLNWHLNTVPRLLPLLRL